MDVPGTHAWGVEGIGTKDLAVGGDDQCVVTGELVAEFGDPGRLKQGEVVRECEFGDGGYCRPASSTTTRVGLRDNELYLVGGGEQAFQDGRREDRGTCEGYLQGVPSALLGEQVLPPLAHGGLARLPIGAVEDQDTVEVVDLVLQDPGERSEASNRSGSPETSWPETVTAVGRSTSTRIPGIERHPSAAFSVVFDLCVRTGLTITYSSSSMAATSTRLRRPTWLAARPTPSLSRMVASMSWVRRTKDSSKVSTGAERVLSTGSPNVLMSSATYTSSGSTSTRSSSPCVRADILAARAAARATADRRLALSRIRHAVLSPVRLSRTGPDISTPGSRADRRPDSTAPESAAWEPSKVSAATWAYGG